jgi:hypothetical protein
MDLYHTQHHEDHLNNAISYFNAATTVASGNILLCLTCCCPGFSMQKIISILLPIDAYAHLSNSWIPTSLQQHQFQLAIKLGWTFLQTCLLMQPHVHFVAVIFVGLWSFWSRVGLYYGAKWPDSAHHLMNYPLEIHTQQHWSRDSNTLISCSISNQSTSYPHRLKAPGLLLRLKLTSTEILWMNGTRLFQRSGLSRAFHSSSCPHYSQTFKKPLVRAWSLF